MSTKTADQKESTTADYIPRVDDVPDQDGNGRQRLLAAALDLFAEKGVGAVKVRELAARANVSHTLIYVQFGGMAGILAALEAWAREQLSSSVDQTLAVYEPGHDQVQESLIKWQTHISQRQQFRQYIQAVVATPSEAGQHLVDHYRSEARRFLLGLRERGLLHDDIDVEWFSIFFVQIGLGSVLTEAFIDDVQQANTGHIDQVRGFVESRQMLMNRALLKKPLFGA